MVLEQLFGARWLERKPKVTFFLGFVYAELGIMSSLLVFPENPSLISIGFISILIIPTLNSLLALEENEDIRQKRFSLGLFRAHSDIIQIYMYLFLGILLAYATFTLILPQDVSSHLFETQLNIYRNAAGAAGSLAAPSGAADQCLTSACHFFSILFNNVKVFTVCIIFSLVYGAGAILFLTWNASVWGSIFGYIAHRTAVLSTNLISFTGTFVVVFPHLITEAMAYFMAVFAGGIVSKAVIREKTDAKRFNHVVVDALIFFGIALVLLVLAAFLEVYFAFPVLSRG
ncbi:MAG: stage II sporulation protein M [Nanoarchaeota archaeon]